MIQYSNVGKRFFKDGRVVEALDGFSLSIETGEFVGLVGPSGCGKSTLLNLTAGLMRPTRGQVRCNGKAVEDVNTRVGYMTQKDDLMPWRTVENNVGLALQIKGIDGAQRKAATKQYIDLVGLSGFETHFPAELSGGMRKRVALARTLIYDPETLLMDEPFGALDAQLKLILHDELDVFHVRFTPRFGELFEQLWGSLEEVIRHRLKLIGARLAILALALSAWEIIGGDYVDTFWISQPSDIYAKLAKWVSTGMLWYQVSITLQEMLIGFLIGASTGIVVGFLLGRNDFLNRLLDPFIMAIYSLPKVALAPLFILWFGIDIKPKIVLAAAIVFFLVFYDTYAGVRDVDTAGVFAALFVLLLISVALNELLSRSEGILLRWKAVGR